MCAQVELPLKESSAAVSTAKAHCDEDESAAVTYYTASVIASPVTVLEPKEEKGIAICPSQKWLSLFFKDFQTRLKILTRSVNLRMKVNGIFNDPVVTLSPSRVSSRVLPRHRPLRRPPRRRTLSAW